MGPLKQTISNNIKHFRERLDISQEELSRICGYSSTYLGKIERGQRSPSLDTLIRIAEALQIPIVSFFDPYYQRQAELSEEWDPSNLTSYDLVMRRFNYLVGRTSPSGEVKEIRQLPWFHASLDEEENKGKKLWDVPVLNFSDPLGDKVRHGIHNPEEGPVYLRLDISGVQLLDAGADFIMIPNFAESNNGDVEWFQFELFYPRIVQKGSQIPLGELSFTIA